jgi:catechol 2,3-dioxygenase-like lactoylglutathione lyase family enzyme
MGVHHLAFVIKDVEATHRFYTEAMGFELLKVEVVPYGDGVARHLFYSTGPKRDQLMAFFDLSCVPNAGELKTDISRDLGYRAGINHLAFSAEDEADLIRRRDRWLAFGRDVLEIDHGWIHSIYTEDPDGIAVEFAVVTKEPTERDASEALELLRAERPAPSAPPVKVEWHRTGAKAAAR